MYHAEFNQYLFFPLVKWSVRELFPNVAHLNEDTKSIQLSPCWRKKFKELHSQTLTFMIVYIHNFKISSIECIVTQKHYQYVGLLYGDENLKNIHDQYWSCFHNNYSVKNYYSWIKWAEVWISIPFHFVHLFFCIRFYSLYSTFIPCSYSFHSIPFHPVSSNSTLLATYTNL